MSGIKNIIFDWSGVIKDAFDAHVWAVNKMLEIWGSPKRLTYNELKENWQQPYMDFWQKYHPGISLEEEQRVYYIAISDPKCPKSNAYNGIVDLIKKFDNKNIKMVVLSSDPPETLLPELKEYNLENIFDEVLCKVHDKAESIHDLLKRNNFEKSETIFIGDSNHEVEVGKMAGIKTMAVTWGFCTEEKLKSTNPDFLVHNIAELENVILK